MREAHRDLRSANAARQKAWDPEGRIGLAFRAMELGGEVGEALNELKKLERERMDLPGSRTGKDAIGMELADVLICVDLIAASLGLDMDWYVAAKFNSTSAKVGLDVWMELPS